MQELRYSVAGVQGFRVSRMGPWPDLADFPFELHETYERVDVSKKPKHLKRKIRDEYLGGRNPGHGCIRV